MGHLQPQHRRHVLWGDVSDCGSFASQSSCTQVSQTKKPSVTTWPPGAGLGMVFTETDTTYNCGAQTNYGASASKTYCINHTTLCFEPPPQDQAPGVPGAAYVGPIQTYQGSTSIMRLSGQAEGAADWRNLPATHASLRGCIANHPHHQRRRGHP
jgi:hypothetical protein